MRPLRRWRPQLRKRRPGRSPKVKPLPIRPRPTVRVLPRKSPLSTLKTSPGPPPIDTPRTYLSSSCRPVQIAKPPATRSRRPPRSAALKTSLLLSPSTSSPPGSSTSRMSSPSQARNSTCTSRSSSKSDQLALKLSLLNLTYAYYMGFWGFGGDELSDDLEAKQ